MMLAFSFGAQAQGKYNTKTATVKFYAKSALQDAKAENHQVRMVLDPATKEMAISLLITSFEFEKALMQTHFNSDMDSEKYPKSTFTGKIISPETMPTGGAAVEVKVKGDLMIHGVTKKLDGVVGTLQKTDGKITVHAEFNIDTKDYKVPTRTGVDNIVKITFDAVLNPA